MLSSDAKILDLYRELVMFRIFFKVLMILFLPITYAFGASEYKAYSDYEREKNWADQIIPSIIVGAVSYTHLTLPTN